MTFRYLALVAALAVGAWLVSSLLSVCTPRGYRVALRMLLAIAAACFLAALVVGCQTTEAQPRAVVRADVERLADARAEAQVGCLALVAAVGVHVGGMESAGHALQLPPNYPETVYIRCLLRRGQFL